MLCVITGVPTVWVYDVFGNLAVDEHLGCA